MTTTTITIIMTLKITVLRLEEKLEKGILKAFQLGYLLKLSLSTCRFLLTAMTRVSTCSTQASHRFKVSSI
jgi:hypothetical protein